MTPQTALIAAGLAAVTACGEVPTDPAEPATVTPDHDTQCPGDRDALEIYADNLEAQVTELRAANERMGRRLIEYGGWMRWYKRKWEECSGETVPWSP